MLLHQEFIKIAKKLPKKMAIIDSTRGTRLTFSKTLIASLMLKEKIEKYKDGFIGVMIPNSAGSILTIIAIVMAGKVPVMINYSTGAAQNSEYAQKKCSFKTIITSRALLEKIGCRLVPGMVFIEDILKEVKPMDKIKAALKSKLPFKMLLKKVYQGEPDDNVVILFTSGSEKDPKAVQLTHRNLYSNIVDSLTVLDLKPEDIILGNLPYFHVFGHNTNLWLPLINGNTLVTIANPLDYEGTVKLISKENVSVVLATPIFFMGYLRKSEPGELSGLRIAVAGADKCPDWLRTAYLEKHNVVLLEGYGTTETSPVISVNSHDFNRPGSIGKPLPNVQVKILDINTGEELPAGREGKIVVKGDIVMKGYFDDIEETSLRIKDGWYDTGDMGMLDEDGYLWHRGRLKRFVKIGGEMVSLVKVESVISNYIPDSVDCCVVEVPDFRKGARIVVVLSEKVNEKEVMAKAREKLSNIELPKEFIVYGELPKMGSGKVAFRKVTEIAKQIIMGRNGNNNNSNNDKEEKKEYKRD